MSVGGCPYIVFKVENVDKHAVYTSGSGTTTLEFKYVLDGGQSAAWITSILALSTWVCTSEQMDLAHFHTGTQDDYPLFIKRASEHPSTSPCVCRGSYVESIVAPTSISGGSTHISLSCSSTACADYNDASLGVTTKMLQPLHH